MAPICGDAVSSCGEPNDGNACTFGHAALIWAQLPGGRRQDKSVEVTRIMIEGLEMPKLPILALAVAAMAGACAPAPLYTASGTHKGAVTMGEVPRDARGEPVWAAIRPVPGASQPGSAAELQEGDAADSPRPPRA